MTSKTLVLITGANQGLGYYAAQQLASKGTYHVLLGSRDISKATQAISTLLSDPSSQISKDSLTPIQIDVNSDESINAAARTVEETYGKLDMLLNNAGIAQDQAATAQVSLRELYRRHFDTNLFGAAVVTEAFLPLLRKGKDKRLAFTGSGVSSLTWATEFKWGRAVPLEYPIYNATKTALSMVLLHYTLRLQDEGFVVSAADPGHCGTGLNGFSGLKDPRDGAKVLIRVLEAEKGDIHGRVVNETEKEPW